VSGILLRKRELAVSRFQAQTNAIPAIERLNRKQDEGLVRRIDLTDAEAKRLAEILDRGFSPTPTLFKALSRVADPKRQPPRLHWKETAA
jgi:hypothetical protein